MMMGRDSGQPAVAGGPAPHIPVLGPQAIEFLALREGGTYVDATFGAGGHGKERHLSAVLDDMPSTTN